MKKITVLTVIIIMIAGLFSVAKAEKGAFQRVSVSNVSVSEWDTCCVTGVKLLPDKQTYVLIYKTEQSRCTGEDPKHFTAKYAYDVSGKMIVEVKFRDESGNASIGYISETGESPGISNLEEKIDEMSEREKEKIALEKERLELEKEQLRLEKERELRELREEARELKVRACVERVESYNADRNQCLMGAGIPLDYIQQQGDQYSNKDDWEFNKYRELAEGCCGVELQSSVCEARPDISPELPDNPVCKVVQTTSQVAAPLGWLYKQNF